MTGKRSTVLAIFISLLCHGASQAWAHEGHGVPGAVPPAPHGGRLKEATGGGAEIFFEAVYQEGKLSLYPLQITERNAFAAVSPKTLSNVECKIELPRSKKTEKISLSPGEEALEGGFDSKGANRFVVHISARYKGTTKLAKIQIEK